LPDTLIKSKVQSSKFKVSEGGLALQSKDGKSIYYIGGIPYAKLVHKFTSGTNVTVRLPTVLPSPVFNAGGVLINGKMFIFNGTGRCVMGFDFKHD
jgi:predicted SPOUT superfamily RNA methylase MTH1